MIESDRRSVFLDRLVHGFLFGQKGMPVNIPDNLYFCPDGLRRRRGDREWTGDLKYEKGLFVSSEGDICASRSGKVIFCKDRDYEVTDVIKLTDDKYEVSCQWWGKYDSPEKVKIAKINLSLEECTSTLNRLRELEYPEKEKHYELGEALEMEK